MTTNIFSIYEILVENVFGSMALAIMGVAFVIFLILALLRVSKEFMVFWISFYFIVMGTFYFGGLGIVSSFIISLIFYMLAVAEWMRSNN